MASKSPLLSIYYKKQKVISSDMDQEEFIPLDSLLALASLF